MGGRNGLLERYVFEDRLSTRQAMNRQAAKPQRKM
jgi:hypothetical protein